MDEERGEGERRGPLGRLSRRALGWALRLAALAVAVALTALLVWAQASRSLGDLEVWHRGGPGHEFRARDARAGFTFADYLREEERAFGELDRFYVAGERAGARALRYVSGSAADPRGWKENWNRTKRLEPEGAPVGHALLVHGLTDGPYSMRTIGELLRARGWSVLILRLPGHGTTPGALLDVSWEDWAEAVRLAWEDVASRAPAGGATLMGGYSTGAALVMREALRRQDGGVREPGAVLLLSPAIGVTSLARVSNLHRVFSWIPYFEKSKWLDIDPEFDPHKYASFPKNAGAQSWGVATALREEMDRASAAGRLTRAARVLTFQSVADATVVARDVVENLHRRLGAGRSELVLFDVNGVSLLRDFARRDPRPVLESLWKDASLPFRMTVVGNRSEESLEVVARTKDAGTTEARTEELGMSWPENVYSLSHVALPFPADDPVYGAHGAMGSLAMRGEKRALSVSAEFLMRLRFNPFFPYVRARIEALAEELERGAAGGGGR